jgi:Zn-dependent metalloprotease
MCIRSPLHCIVPPQLLRQLLQHEDPHVREAALSTLISTARLRGQRELLAQTFAPLSSSGRHRSVYDAHGAATTTGKLVRDEGAAPVGDKSVNEVYDGFGATYALFKEVFGRDSIDGKGLRLEGVVHYGKQYNNAFWNGARMMFGDGDGKLFTSFTKSIDVIAHELSHGVTEFTCNLEYHKQSGALNESMSDVFGSLVKQYALKQSATSADWLIGAGILGPIIKGVALRSLKKPGSAYDGDDQPSTMDGYEDAPDTEAGDWGNVHRNSGIPNHAFYLVATSLGGNAWEDAGQIWYDTLLSLHSTATFGECASLSYHMAGRRFGEHSRQQQAVADAWSAVKVNLMVGSPPPSGGPIGTGDLRDKLQSIARELDAVIQTT